MNKTELIEAIAEQADIPKSKAGAALEALTSTVTAQLQKGDQVVIAGFGKFEVRHTEAKTVNSFGKETKVPAKNHPKFIPLKALKDAVNQ